MLMFTLILLQTLPDGYYKRNIQTQRKERTKITIIFK